MTDIATALRTNRYPGRLLLLARTGDGELVAGYALTGRSPSSKDREIVMAGGRLMVRPRGDQGHDALRHYVAAQAGDGVTVFGNGSQVGEVHARLAGGAPPAVALDDLRYEPDPPIFTPRITAVVDQADGTGWLGAARRPAGRRESTDITVTVVRDLAVGDAVLLTTYISGGDTVRTAPHHLDLHTTATDATALCAEMAASLDPRFAVAVTTFTPLDGLAHVIVRPAAAPSARP